MAYSKFLLFCCCVLWTTISVVSGHISSDSRTVNNIITTGTDCLKTHSIEGTLDTADIWYGFIVNISIQTSGSIKFLFSYPYDMQIQNVILYSENEVGLLNEGQSCWQKEGVIPAEDAYDRIMDLSSHSSWNGCLAEESFEGKMVVCESERVYEQPEKIYMAVSKCRGINGKSGLFLNYQLEINEVLC